MASLVTDIRQLRKKRAIIPAESLSPAPPVPFLLPETNRDSPDAVSLARLIGMNPALSLLIETLDLELTRAELPPGHARLWDLAGQALTGGATYTRLEAIDRIRIKTNVSQERAEKGFDLMIESRAIEPTVDALTYTTHTDLFYLGGSTPF
jgi:hypothetical protein